MSLQSVYFVKEDGHAYAKVLDMLLLPHESVYLHVKNVDEGASVIRKMQVRGAPAIAIVGCLSLAAELINRKPFETPDLLHQFIIDSFNKLIEARPTAVNIKNEKENIVSHSNNILKEATYTVQDHTNLIIKQCEELLDLDININKCIGDYGANQIIENCNEKEVTVLTHCNTGSLATGGYGTALGVVRSLHGKGKLSKVFFCETRPYNQGSRLTAYELLHDKIPHTLICDSMAGAFLSSYRCHAVVVGADRVALNGDTANKIGTLQIAILSKYYGVPFYVAAPLSTVDKKIENGDLIVIEERPSEELTTIGGKRISPTGVNCWNPAFDVTPADLITGIITERGVFKPSEVKSKINYLGES